MGCHRIASMIRACGRFVKRLVVSCCVRSTGPTAVPISVSIGGQALVAAGVRFGEVGVVVSTASSDEVWVPGRPTSADRSRQRDVRYGLNLPVGGDSTTVIPSPGRLATTGRAG